VPELPFTSLPMRLSAATATEGCRNL
jgi:hypothetical protein